MIMNACDPCPFLCYDGTDSDVVVVSNCSLL